MTNELPDDGLPEFDSSLRATYSPEDNKLRLYSDHRLSAELYARVKSAGFRWAPKQQVFVAPRWTCDAEDLLLELCPEIEDEDYSPVERAADRAERFAGYRDKRRAEATGSADRFDSGPSVFGNSDGRRAEKLAMRHDRFRTSAVSQWSKAEYWQERTAGVIGHALYKSDPRVRRGRILTIETDERKHRAAIAESRQKFERWQTIARMPADEATKLATAYAGRSSFYVDVTHPRTGRKATVWSLLTDESDPITGHEAAALMMAVWGEDPFGEHSRGARWLRHYAMRLTYERAMLANEGGSADEAEMIPGGFLKGRQIISVTKSPATKRITSVVVLVDGKEVRRNVQRLGEDSYRAPTSEELEAFKVSEKARKSAKKAVTPSLMNPTDADAERLQSHWNALLLAASEKAKAAGRHGTYQPGKVIRITQAQYSANSKGDCARLGTVDITAAGIQKSRYRGSEDTTPAAFSLRVQHASFAVSYSASSVIILTDKPQKPLPWTAESTKQEEPAAV